MANTGSFLSNLFTTSGGLQGLGSFLGGVGSIYGGIQQANAMNKMNDFRMNAYTDQLNYQKDADRRRQRAGAIGYGGLGSYSNTATPKY
jgi:hypothetical protein